MGWNTYEVELRDQKGKPLTAASAAGLRFIFMGAELGQSQALLAPAGPGRFRAQGSDLSLDGPWQAEVVVKRQNEAELRTIFRFHAPSARVSSVSPAVRLSFSRGTQVALELLALGAVLVLIGWKLGLRLPGRLTLGVGALVEVAGLALLVAAQLPTQSAASQRNPLVPSESTVQAGLQLYTQYCQVCHGPAGRGDGPLAPTLTPPPLDLTVHVPLHSDGGIYRFISKGLKGTAMPAFEGTLKSEDLWSLVHYLRTLKAKLQ
ncbi:MAG: c-type cytochrome [Chloroflexi bacterium]|nr:c-type cytochrome [Chloroflexota bacterium]